MFSESEEWSSQWIFQFKQLERRSLKKSGLQRDSNPWPPRYRCDALPTELWSHTLGARSFCWAHIFPWGVKWCKYIWNNWYIWTAVIDESEEWSSQWIFQFKQLERRSLKKIRASTGFEPVTSANILIILHFFTFIYDIKCTVIINCISFIEINNLTKKLLCSNCQELPQSTRTYFARFLHAAFYCICPFICC